jgi:E3 ubiquitin-protein ligase NEDD4
MSITTLEQQRGRDHRKHFFLFWNTINSFLYSSSTVQDQQNQTELERRQHNARGLPEERPSAANSTTSLESRSTTPTPTPNAVGAQNNMTTAGSGPLPPGWGKKRETLNSQYILI